MSMAGLSTHRIVVATKVPRRAVSHPLAPVLDRSTVDLDRHSVVDSGLPIVGQITIVAMVRLVVVPWRVVADLHLHTRDRVGNPAVDFIREQIVTLARSLVVPAVVVLHRPAPSLTGHLHHPVACEEIAGVVMAHKHSSSQSTHAQILRHSALKQRTGASRKCKPKADSASL